LLAGIRRRARPFQRVLATLLAAAVAPLVPSRLDPFLTTTVSSRYLALLPQRRTVVAKRMAEHLGLPADDLQQRAADYWRHRVETRWGQARAISIGDWKPTIDVAGGEHLDAALAAGRGAILWTVSPHSGIPLFAAMEQRDTPVAALSQYNHGLLVGQAFFDARVGPAVSPLMWRGENRHLGERVVLTATNTTAALRRLLDVLASNGVVKITGDLDNGHAPQSVTVNRADLRIATGAARLAQRSGAALLPVTVTFRSVNRVQIEILAPLAVPTGSGKAASAELVERFAGIVAEFVRADPAQWPKWRITLS
jgi:lauroyl/myristoyl acyltransferase